MKAKQPRMRVTLCEVDQKQAARVVGGKMVRKISKKVVRSDSVELF